jgi:hypothetical protein
MDLLREATPLMKSSVAAQTPLKDIAKPRPSGLTPLEVAASVAVLSVRRLRRRTTLFGRNRVVHKTMGGWGSFLFLSNLITGASRGSGAAAISACRGCVRLQFAAAETRRSEPRPRCLCATLCYVARWQRRAQRSLARPPARASRIRRVLAYASHGARPHCADAQPRQGRACWASRRHS